VIDRSRLAIVALAALGTTVSAYLSWVHLSGALALCVGVGGCEAVQSSRYATIGPVPVALIGLFGFAAILAAAIAFARGVNTASLLFGLSLAASAYTAYLTYIEVFVLGAICPWCVSVALFSLAICFLSARSLANDLS
jgi:uncharacterized membrane protein